MPIEEEEAKEGGEPCGGIGFLVRLCEGFSVETEGDEEPEEEPEETGGRDEGALGRPVRHEGQIRRNGGIGSKG